MNEGLVADSAFEQVQQTLQFFAKKIKLIIESFKFKQLNPDICSASL